MYLGIDFGTSGCRAVVIDAQQAIIAEARQSLAPPQSANGRIQQSASVWLEGLHHLFLQLAENTDLSQIRRIAIDGTSATTLICDAQGQPLSPALMYNDSSSRQAVETIRKHCPSSEHITLSAGSSLAKALQLVQNIPSDRIRVLSQADFLSSSLSGHWGFSDYHNALKLGYDVERLEWPDWISRLLASDSLPQVLTPGEVIGPIDTQFAKKYGLSADCMICAGSTDANAAFLATRSSALGDAVTSLGSTLVLKILNDRPIQQLVSGVYSHRLGDLWLCGGASNAGAAILRQYFSDRQIAEYSSQINPDQTSGLDYYPLSGVGERFPYNDPEKRPVLSPRPASDITFLQGILEGLSRIEKTGYEKLQVLGASVPIRIQSCGGGAKNPQWTAMRSRLLGIPVQPAEHTEACFGSALLALQGLGPYVK